jgi:glycosyltransferase involved in cell wall biosynthesis
MRLAIDADNFARDRRGMGRVARGVVQAACSERDVETTLLVQRRGGAAAVQATFPDVPLTLEPASSARREGRYDVLWFPWNGMRFSGAAPAVVTMHDVFAFSDPPRGWIARARVQMPMRRAARRAERLVAPSVWTRDRIAETFAIDPARIEVIPNVPDPYFFPGADADIVDEPYALMVGVQEPRKNARVVIEACAKAFSERDTLVIVGGIAEPDRALLARLSIRHRLIDEADDGVVRALYRNARAVAVPSTAEGFGLVAVEAMACAAATLAAEAAALPEATQGGALLIQPHDVDGWANALRRTMHDETFRAALSARAAGRFAFAPRSAAARAYLDLFARIAVA